MTNYLELEGLKNKHTGEVCIFGAGIIGRNEAYEILTLAGFKVDFYFDNHIMPGTHIRDGVYVKELQYLYDNKDSILVFVCVSYKNKSDVLKQLLERDVKNIVFIDRGYITKFLDSVELADEEVKERYYSFYNDEECLKTIFKRRMGYELNLLNPKTYNEKLQWLKLYDRKSEYPNLVDKYEFKKYITQTIGAEYVVPTLGVWNSVEEIEWDRLPQRFVIKCTHDSGSAIVCKDKKEFDIKSACEKLGDAYRTNFYWKLREWPYKDVKPRIIAEEYLEDEHGELRDYKFFTFSGKVKVLFIATERENPEVETKFDFFDKEFNHLEIINGHPCAATIPEKPYSFDKMIELAEILSIDIPHVRVDFYEVCGRIYVGEMTFSHWGGFVPFEPPVWDEIFGSYINLGLQEISDKK